MKIPFVDLKAQYQSISSRIDEAVKQVIHSGYFINGKFVRAFEKDFAEFCNAKHCIGVGNGTDALFIALRSLGIGPGDEVIVPANTFIATSEAVSMAGANVVFVDCDPQTYNMNLSKIRLHISNRTKAIVPVHLYGQPVDMHAIKKIAKKYELAIVQDCAQAHGAKVDGKPLAFFGDVLCFSFYPGKNLGAYGDAGAIVSNDDVLAERLRMVANHGRLTKYDHEFEGVNSRMDEIQAAVLHTKLKYLPLWTEKRIKVASQYNTLLHDVGDLVTPAVSPNVRHVFHLYVIRTQRRNALQKHLNENEIASGIHYPIALPNLKAYRGIGYRPESFPVANAYQEQILSLPMYPELTTGMVKQVVEGIRSFFDRT